MIASPMNNHVPQPDTYVNWANAVNYYGHQAASEPQRSKVKRTRRTRGRSMANQPKATFWIPPCFGAWSAFEERLGRQRKPAMAGPVAHELACPSASRRSRPVTGRLS